MRSNSATLGAVETGLGQSGEEIDRRVRAEMLDEGIDLLPSLWAGRLRFRGRHYQVDLAGRPRAAAPADARRHSIIAEHVDAEPKPGSIGASLRAGKISRCCR